VSSGLDEHIKKTSQGLSSAASCGIRHRARPVCRSEGEPTLTLGGGKTSLLVSLLSLGLCGLIWGALSLLAT
jgi:hypothetical protein